MPKRRLAAPLLVALLLPGSALAASPAERLAAPCQGCHGVVGAMPTLVGRHSVAELAAMLRDFRSDARPATVMGRIARGYTEEEIGILARYYAKPD